MRIIAETIRGINVVISGDTTGLSRALADVNKQSRDITSELKQVEKGLRLDPTNTTLLAQKQRLLADAIANSRERLDRLRAAQEQVNQQFARGEINDGQYRAFQREVVAAEQELRRFEDRLEETNRTSRNLGETLEKAGEKMKGVGEKMTVAITAPIAAAGGVMLKGAIDAENATGKLQAQLGLTADEAADLGAVAQDVWVNGFGENIDEATESIKLVRQNMAGLAEDDLSSVTQGAMTIADVFGADVTDSTKTAGTMMKNFGISGQEALDLITVGFQKGGDFSGELLDTLNEYSPQFASMGMSADQMLGILIKGAQAGAFNLDKVGDAVKEFNIRAQDGSKTTAQGFQMIGLDAQKMGEAIAQGGEKGQQAFAATVAALAAMKDPMQQNIAGTALFGTQWEDVRAKVITAMADGVQGLGNFQGATAAAAKAAYDNNPGLALTMALREVQAAIGPALLPLADTIKNNVVPAIKSLADWFANLSPAGQKTVLVIAGIAAAIGPLLVVIGNLIAIAPALGTAITIATGPIGLIVVAIAAAVAAGVLLYQNWDKLSTGAKALVMAFTPIGAIVGVIKGIQYALSDSVPKIDLFGDGVSKATQKAVGGFLDLNTKATDALDQLNWSGQAITKDTANGITKTFDEMGSQIAQGLDKKLNESLGVMKNFFANSSALTQQEETDAINKMTTSYENQKQAIQDGENKIKEILTKASGEKRALTSDEKQQINKIQQDMVNTGIQALSKNELESRVIMEKMKQQAGDISARQAAEVVQNSEKQKEGAIKAADDQYDQTIAQIIKMRDESHSITADQAEKLIADAKKQHDEIVKKAEDTQKKVVEAAKKQAGDHVNEVNWETGQVLSHWEKFKNDTVQKWNGMWQDAKKAWNNIRTSVISEAEELKSEAKNKLDELWNYIQSIPGEAKQWGKDIIQGLINGIKSLHIPMPHFKFSVHYESIAGAEFPVPAVGVNWYAKGGIFTSPTIAGIGDVPEAVMPLAKLPALMTDALVGAVQHLTKPVIIGAGERGSEAVVSNSNSTLSIGNVLNVESMTPGTQVDVHAIAREATALLIRELTIRGFKLT